MVNTSLATIQFQGQLAKASEPIEIAFYSKTEEHRSNQKSNSLSEFASFIPKYYGLHKSEHTIDSNSPHVDKPFIRIEDACSGLKRACVFDLKMGCVLFEESANVLKKAKMTAYASATTAEHFGVLVWDPDTSTFMKFPKKYGYSLTSATLPLGIRQFFVDSRGKFVHRHHINQMLNQLTKLREILSKPTGIQMISSSILLIFDGEKMDGESSCSSDFVKVIDFNHSYYHPNTPENPYPIDQNYLHGLSSLISLLEAVYQQPYLPPPKRAIRHPQELSLKDEWAFWWDMELTKKVLQIFNPGLHGGENGAGAKRLKVASLIGKVNQPLAVTEGWRNWYKSGAAKKGHVEEDVDIGQLGLHKYSTT